MYQRAVAWYEDGGEAVRGGAHDSWHTLALLGAGRLEEAMEICERRLAQNPESLWYHGMTGFLAARMGDRERLTREKAYMESLAPDHYPGWLPFQMAYFQASEGRAEAAVASLRSAMNQGYAFNVWWHRDPAFDLVRDHPSFQELIRPKG